MFDSIVEFESLWQMRLYLFNSFEYEAQQLTTNVIYYCR